MKKLTTKQIIIKSILPIMLLITIIAWIPAIMASMREFYAGLSFFEADYVGLDNYTKLLNEDMPWNVCKNSFLFSSITAILGGVLAGIFTFIIRKLPKRLGVVILSVIALCSGMCLTITLLYPGVFEVIAEPIYQMILIYTGYEAVSWLPFWLVFAVAYAKNCDSKSILKLITTFVLIRIIMLFAMGNREIVLMENPINKEFLETLGVWMFHNYRTAGDYCNTMAVSVIVLICSLPLALIFALAVHKMFKSEIGFFRCLMYALIIVLNHEVIMCFFSRILNEGVLFDVLRMIPHIAIVMLLWEICKVRKETLIPAVIILAVRGAVTYCVYQSVFLGIVARNVYEAYRRNGENFLTIEINANTYTPYIILCIALGILCSASILISAYINHKKSI